MKCSRKASSCVCSSLSRFSVAADAPPPPPAPPPAPVPPAPPGLTTRSIASPASSAIAVNSDSADPTWAKPSLAKAADSARSPAARSVMPPISESMSPMFAFQLERSRPPIISCSVPPMLIVSAGASSSARNSFHIWRRSLIIRRNPACTSFHTALRLGGIAPADVAMPAHTPDATRPRTSSAAPQLPVLSVNCKNWWINSPAATINNPMPVDAIKRTIFARRKLTAAPSAVVAPPAATRPTTHCPAKNAAAVAAYVARRCRLSATQIMALAIVSDAPVA